MPAGVRTPSVLSQLLVCPDDIDVDFRAIGGLSSQINELREVTVLPMSRPDLFRQSRLSRPPTGVLLYGE